MKTRVILTIFAFLSVSSVAQPLTKKYVEDWIFQCDTSVLNPNNGVMYIVDGVPTVEDALSDVDLSNEYLTIDYIYTNDLKDNRYFKPDQLLVLVRTNQKKLKKSQIKEDLSKARNSFVDDYSLYQNHILENAKDPVLVIDNLAVKHSDAREKIDTIEPSQIKLIVFVNHAPQSIYGQNAVNGLWTLWLK